jgi:hypothetical protein
MKRILIIIFGLLITAIGFSQNRVKVEILPSKIASRTLMIIPLGDKYIYEDYTYFKSVYWLNLNDTLALINDSTLSSDTIRINLKLYSIEYDFCDSKINYIRNSSLSHRIFSMTNDSCKKFIGLDNNEFEIYQRDLAFEEEFEKKTCSDSFPKIAYQRFDSLKIKIQDIYNKKMQRAKWIKDNHSKIDKSFINAFLIDFNYNKPDNESFIQILIANPAGLIEEIDKLNEPYQILWRVREIRNIPGILEAIGALEKSGIKGKTKRQILRQLKKNEG